MLEVGGLPRLREWRDWDIKDWDCRDWRYKDWREVGIGTVGTGGIGGRGQLGLERWNKNRDCWDWDLDC